MRIDVDFRSGTSSRIGVELRDGRSSMNVGFNSVNTITGGEKIPRGGFKGDLLTKRSDKDFDMEWITPADHSEQDNTRPITAAAVYMEIGNINALLETI